jgi:hypothetical protein
VTERYTDGQPVIVIDVDGNKHAAIARSDVEGRFRDGRKVHDFPVVWVEIPRYDDGTDRIPWPAEAVHARTETT